MKWPASLSQWWVRRELLKFQHDTEAGRDARQGRKRGDQTYHTDRPCPYQLGIFQFSTYLHPQQHTTSETQKYQRTDMWFAAKFGVSGSAVSKYLWPIIADLLGLPCVQHISFALFADLLVYRHPRARNMLGWSTLLAEMRSYCCSADPASSGSWPTRPSTRHFCLICPLDR